MVQTIDTQVLLKLLEIAEVQFKLDDSGKKRMAEAFKRRSTVPRLQKLGFTPESPSYLEAYSAVRDADEAEKQLEATSSPLALLARAKMAFTQGGV